MKCGGSTDSPCSKLQKETFDMVYDDSDDVQEIVDDWRPAPWVGWMFLLLMVLGGGIIAYAVAQAISMFVNHYWEELWNKNSIQ